MDVHQRETPCVVERKELIEQQNMNSDGACIPMTIRLHAVSTILGDMHMVIEGTKIAVVQPFDTGWTRSKETVCFLAKSNEWGHGPSSMKKAPTHQEPQVKQTWFKNGKPSSRNKKTRIDFNDHRDWLSEEIEISNCKEELGVPRVPWLVCKKFKCRLYPTTWIWTTRSRKHRQTCWLRVD